MAAPAFSALIVGGTGAVGRQVLKELLANPQILRVSEYGRRVTSSVDLPSTINPPGKLTQRVVNFDKIQEEGLRDGKFDLVVITLGTTRGNAGSWDNFVKIDREYVLATAAAARVPGLKQKIIYCSSFGAGSDKLLPYAKSKGLTEEGIAKVGYDDTIIFRPGFLTERGGNESRILEGIFRFFTGILSHFSPHVEIKTSEVAKGMIQAALKGSSGLPPEAEVFTAGGKGDVPLYHVVGNKGNIAIAKEQS
ncbi:uncharacterized protein EI90DRAFT_2998225 [Cantharellus anzutake]|uniref:uncharacterized protein n=1 Tax=Cantharellus anzutake TaxID=1750568 RepID=UPI0019049466|nr:uncharacterized protein EI90DRAFT_2998225 [Cantharellus anzutake]KAF8328229.1 hypothetical protein EI90DRAFT_2998225 [Cantharellus anzutake]